ncbi:FAD-dependent oxidoreductase [Paenibacillus sp. 1P07SE]|uniref:FAD-dependent oxidoreductase n=1 Tax=Paenibacillus sp. 1P07SE TaxID=3132209 RepID=UPI0039A5CAB0
MKNETVASDITVVGGGLAGVCAAIAAARMGQQVALVQNRPVLGGNSSSEVRVWVCGATAHGANRYARETGVMGELFVENQYRNMDGNPYIWDLVVLEAVRAEPNIRLFLNTDVHEVEADGPREDRMIRSITGWMMGSERRIRFESAIYLDCTGDGLVGFLAGADFRIGREARHEYQEDWAPEVADDITLGSTMLFYTKDAGHPVKFTPPSFAKNIAETSIPLNRVIRSGDNGCAYWWIEWGGELDTVHDNERIRDELWSVIYGIWDYIKNSGQFDSDNMTLEWIGSVPGKREYRRFVGDYVLNQQDILNQEPFEDRVAFGGWSIDLHPPQGVYATERGSKHLFADGIYHIPFRSLYSANTRNLMFAGRDISASHVAFGTTRVMATCAVIGEAAGSGAALAVRRGVSPRAIHREHMAELQQQMLRQDASIIGLRSADPEDLIRQAQVTASSTLSRFAVEDADGTHALAEADLGILLPVAPELKRIELLIDAAADTELTVSLWDTGRPENYVPHTEIARTTLRVPEGASQWIEVPLSWQPESERNGFLILAANPHISVHTGGQQSGMLLFLRGDAPQLDPDAGTRPQPLKEWSMNGLRRRAVCLRAYPETTAYGPDRTSGGYLRPYGGPQLWSSELLADGEPAWLQYDWRSPVSLRTVQLVFNDDVNEDLINLHHHRTPFEAIPELVKDYRLEVRIGDAWVTIAEVTDNYKRKRNHTLAEEVRADALRLVIEATNGCPRAEVVEVRAYA